MNYGLVSDFLLILGAVAIVAGIGFVFWPAALVTGGCFLIAGGIAIGKAEAAGDKK